MKFRLMVLLIAFTMVVAIGYWLAGTAAPKVRPRAKTEQEPTPPARWATVEETMPVFRRSERPPAKLRDDEARSAGALEGERILVFSSQDDLARFLERAGDSIRILGRLDALNALRVGFTDAAELLAMLDGETELSLIFPVISPYPEEGSIQAGAVPLGASLLDWLGVKGDHSDWGRGVKIAVLDTGVLGHSAFNTSIQTLNLVAPGPDGSEPNGHGTAVASMIIGNGSLTPGVAPGAGILSVRIANDNGQSDSFLLAQGIIAAVDAGAQLINISMGSFGDSVLVRNAIAYAGTNGVMIIAAAGNNGMEQVLYPAANSGVIAVGAVDAQGRHLDFSNSGESVALAAPGYGLNAAWPGDMAARVTGTSFSAPIVTGSIAALMTEGGGLTPAQAYALMTRYLNDGGEAGSDPQLGLGMPDLGRALAGNTPGIYDAALAYQRIIPPDPQNPNGQVEILVQNRGTETLINTAVEVSSGGGKVTSNLTSIQPNAVQSIRVPLGRPLDPVTGLKIDAQVRLSGGFTDAKPTNDRWIETHVAQPVR